MLHISIDINEVDYEAFLDFALPLVGDKLEGSAGKLLAGGGGMAKSLLRHMPDGKKDAVAADFINKYGDRLIPPAEDFARKQGVRLRVSHISAKP